MFMLKQLLNLFRQRWLRVPATRALHPLHRCVCPQGGEVYEVAHARIQSLSRVTSRFRLSTTWMSKVRFVLALARDVF